ncbi:MAG: Flp pilus assembly complex ATPase component TadA [Planctomycetes bacterium]|nr:Flp pilus assembly complex ATPase component TadA [Planctomycetota bacterium]
MSTATDIPEANQPQATTLVRTAQSRAVAFSPRRQSMPLGEQLVEAELLTRDELEDALKLQASKGQKLGEILLELGVITEDQMLPFIQRQLRIPSIRLREGVIDPAVVRILPREAAERLTSLAMFKVRGVLSVAMTEPQNLEQLDELERITGLKVRPVFAFASNIQRMMTRAYEEDFAVDTVTADMDEAAVELQNEDIELDLSSVESMVDGSPVINLVNYLILQSLRKGASDIHIEPTRKHTIVRFRVDGQLIEVLRPRRDIHAAIVSRIKVMSKMDIAEHRIPQDGRCQVAVEGKEVDLRISTLPTVLGEKVVLRVLDRRRVTFNLDKLGMPPESLINVKNLLARPYGLLLVTGPTGSGKTTTLYSALELIKSVHRNIITVEDPVEYQLELINQVQAEKSRQLSFATALRAILRQDPDIIMVGEIRDGETAQVAVQAALTGHLVLSTLHTNDAAGAITRLQDMDVEPFKISAAVVGVIAQRLIRTICPKCRTSYYPPADFLESIHYEGDKRRSFARGEGCKDCYDTGFQGRLGIYEVLVIEQELREMISANSGVEEIRSWFRKNGGNSLLEEGLRMAEQELTSLDEVMRIAFVE